MRRNGKSAAAVVIMVLVAAFTTASEDQEGSYRIEQPGTITFTVGLQITGKIDKPQVMIFLPKERPVLRDIELSKSFESQIFEPLPFEPVKNW